MTEKVKFHPKSWHVNEQLYDYLTDLSDAWQSPRSDQPGLSSDVMSFLALEARLLDTHQYNEWLDLYTADCIYWIPASWPAGNPSQSITLEFHDRRRLIDRITRIETGFAYSQIPPSRTSRILSFPEVWRWGEHTILARSPFVLSEVRQGVSRSISGWYGFALEQHNADWRVKVKQINLLNCDHPQGNNSFFL